MTLRLNGSTSGYTEIDAPAVAGSNTLVLPTGNGTSGQVLTTNGSGVLSWAGAGKILQVASTTKTDTFSTTNTAYTDITGLSASITPTSSSSKILVFGHVDVGSSADVLVALQIVRDSTAVGIADAAGSRVRAGFGRYLGTATTGSATHSNVPFGFYDSPATTSSTTYKIQISSNLAGTLLVNRGSLDTDAGGIWRGTSTITVMEIAA